MRLGLSVAKKMTYDKADAERHTILKLRIHLLKIGYIVYLCVCLYYKIDKLPLSLNNAIPKKILDIFLCWCNVPSGMVYNE